MKKVRELKLTELEKTILVYTYHGLTIPQIVGKIRLEGYMSGYSEVAKKLRILIEMGYVKRQRYGNMATRFYMNEGKVML